MHIIIFVTSHFVLNTISLQHHREHLFAQKVNFILAFSFFHNGKLQCQLGIPFFPFILVDNKEDTLDDDKEDDE